MQVREAQYISSEVTLNRYPKPDRPEYAFAGRSNVGKSSLLNLLTGRRKLAKISQTPGKTKTINHFLINQRWYLADLPGYGFAKVSKSQRKRWDDMIKVYLAKRPNLQCAFILIDCAIPVQNTDIHFINWLGEQQIAFSIVFTKSDRCSKGRLQIFETQFKNALKPYWESLPTCFVTSSKSKAGREPLLEHIEALNVRSGLK